MNALEQWKNDVHVYNETYEAINRDLKQIVKEAKPLLESKSPSSELANVAIKLSIVTQRLVDSVAAAGYNVRGINELRNITLQSEYNKEIPAEFTTLEVFELWNEARMCQVAVTNRWDATLELIRSVRSKLDYGYQPHTS